jgi:polyribonucleotide nucleotidyltransferase
MGLIAEGGQYVTLTDILGAEDALGDMDFKVAGTRDMVTAIQLDMKVTGLPQEVLAQALKQAKDARLHILDVMAQTISEPREALSTKAPRVVMIQIPVDKIGEVIGPKGKRINEIIAVTGADINIEDDGRVFIGSRDGESAAAATEMIEAIANPKPILVGERYEGTVVKTTTFGAFVNITPSRDGLVHISKLGRGKRLSAVEDAVKQGDHLTVEVQDIDPMGKISLKPVGEGWDPPEGGWPRPEGGDAQDDRPPRREGDRPRGGDRDRFRRREGGERRERRDG